ncbi:beta-N-acetylglucosaminidase domain-containing protein [Streptomyces sp. NPDC057702]|uniref:beta-N-acetylglucosaminidase domain-containing protein n=1 Tax=unclassified Streptomyces TaxID=2593676 RepID=UPI00367A1EBD
MRLRGKRTTTARVTVATGATAVAAAVIGGLLGPAPAAVAAPAPKRPEAPSAAPSPDRPGAERLPSVWPRPQSMRPVGPPVPVTDDVRLVAPRDADPHALGVLRSVLRGAGARTVTAATGEDPAPPGGLVVLAGGPGAERALRALRAPARGDLPSGGYRLATGHTGGHPTLALSGEGPDGLFHAVQTLRQLVVDRDGRPGGPRSLAGVNVRDWPATRTRGITEGFYGTPWSHRQRLDQLDFLGRTKQNRYLYAPGDDTFRQARWREPYPAERRAEFRELADRARRNHVTLGWAVAPGQAMCFSSSEDLRALTRKVDAMWALGVRSFQLQFQDVSYSEWHCDADADAFGSGPEAAAQAQATVADVLAAHLAERHPGAEALSLLPTEYYQKGATEFREALAEALSPRVEVAWTGVGVVPRTITGREMAEARKTFAHPLVTMDNYPVNDYAQDRLFLGPYSGRDPAVAGGSSALLANAMRQPTASRIPLFTTADFAWNPRGYRAPDAWRAAVEDLAGQDPRTRAALHALAGNDASSLLGGWGRDRSRTVAESGYLRPLLDEFWAAREAAQVNGGSPARRTGARGEVDSAAERRFAGAAQRLRAEFRTLREAPKLLAETFDGEVTPWLTQLGRFGAAGERAVTALTAQARGDGAGAWRAQRELRTLRARTTASSATVGKGVLPEFLTRAVTETDAWWGLDTTDGGKRAREFAPDKGAERATDGDPTTAFRPPPPPASGAPDSGSPGDTAAAPLTVTFGERRPLSAVTVLAETSTPGVTGRPARPIGQVEARVPGHGWLKLGDLSASGWTQTAGKGVRADAVRLRWAAGVRPPVVREITPWFADAPVAELRLSHTETDAEIGGRPATVKVWLTGRRPGDVSGDLTVRATGGLRVTAPPRITAPRGGTATADIEVAVPAGTRPGAYQLPIRFGSQRATLTVRARPRTGGPDLARTARATSSADESADFPASAAIDGDPATRWSSPATDDAWLQLELDRPTRLGRLDLHWQDAHATRYRVQVSTNGHTWRTAATVDSSDGGRETVHLDAPDTHFIRVQGDQRATRFGYSLWSIRAYAVTP